MKKFKLITSIISLILSICLVVNIAVAWFSVNKNANANSNVSVIDKVEVIENVSFYKVSSDNGSVITLGSNLGSGSSSYDMDQYSILKDDTTTTIMALKIKDSITTIDISFKTSLTETIYKNLIGYNSSDTSTGIQSANNSLSSILKVGYVSATSITTNTIVYEELSYSNFVTRTTYADTNTETISVGDIEYTNLSTVDNYIFISIDYDADLIEYLYNKNLGNTNLATTTGYVAYVTDFSVEVKGGE